MKRLLSIAMAFLIILSTFSMFAPQVKAQEATNTPEQTVSDEWPMHRHDLQRTGFSAGLAPNVNSTLWKYEVGEIMHLSGPAVAEGKVVVGLGNIGYVYCINASDGSFIWRYKTGWHVWSGAAIVDGKVYIGSSDGYVYCFDVDDGTVLWKYSTGPADGTQVFSSPAVADGKVYIGAKNNYVYCLNASDGTLIWKFKTGYIVWSSPAIFDDKVYIGSRDSYVYCLNASDGSQIWRYKTGDAIYRDPAVWDGRVYIASYDNYIYALDAYDGNLVWRYETGNDIHCSPAVAYGNVYIGSYDNYVYALDAMDGSLIWKYKTGAQIRASSPAVADGKVFIGSRDHFVYCFDAYDGTLIWKYQTGGEIWYSPAIAYGNVYIGSDDGYVYSFGPSAPPPDFDISVSPEFQTMGIDQSASFSIILMSISGYSSQISLSASMSPTTNQIFLKFDNDELTLPSGSFVESKLTVITKPTSTTGTYDITITASNGEKTHTIGATLSVREDGFSFSWSDSKKIRNQLMYYIFGVTTPFVTSSGLILYNNVDGMFESFLMLRTDIYSPDEPTGTFRIVVRQLLEGGEEITLYDDTGNDIPVVKIAAEITEQKIREEIERMGMLYLYEKYGDSMFRSIRQPFINAAQNISPEALEATKLALNAVKTGQDIDTVLYSEQLLIATQNAANLELIMTYTVSAAAIMGTLMITMVYIAPVA